MDDTERPLCHAGREATGSCNAHVHCPSRHLAQAINPDSIAHAAELIAQSDALIVAAGAGIGVDSGRPDFRGKEGFWQAYPALGREGVDFYRIRLP